MILALSMFSPHAHAATQGIAAVVNQDVITIKDLNDRLRMIIASSGLPEGKEFQNKLTAQVLNDLIEEQLKIQEAARKEITVSDSDVAAGFAQIAQNNKLTTEQFDAIMKHDGIERSTVERQIRAQIGWSKVIQEVMRPQVTVTDTDIDDYLERFKASKGKNEYQLAEIFLPVEGKAEGDTLQLAQKLVAEIKAGKAPFFKVAQQFSGAAGAESGGDLGWVQQGQLQPELDSALASMQKDTVSDPIRTNDGYHILYLRNVRTITDESIPPREKVFSMIGIQRLERMQARQLLELKTTAFIETRVES
jgi:peptidyl-prolyl cis-trans isomerase SurA